MHGKFRNFKRDGRIPWPWKMAGALIIIPGLVFLGTWVTMLLWNALLPAIFGLGVITFWQAMGLILLGKILFGGFHGGGNHRSHFPRRPRFKDREEWREHMREHFSERSEGFNSEEVKPEA